MFDGVYFRCFFISRDDAATQRGKEDFHAIASCFVLRSRNARELGRKALFVFEKLCFKGVFYARGGAEAQSLVCIR